MILLFVLSLQRMTGRRRNLILPSLDKSHSIHTKATKPTASSPSATKPSSTPKPARTHILAAPTCARRRCASSQTPASPTPGHPTVDATAPPVKEPPTTSLEGRASKQGRESLRRRAGVCCAKGRRVACGVHLEGRLVE